jgi:hypothetical protein
MSRTIIFVQSTLIYSILWSVTVTNTRIAIIFWGGDYVLTNVGAIQLNRPLPLSSTSFLIYYSLAVPPQGAIHTQPVSVSWGKPQMT